MKTIFNIFKWANMWTDKQTLHVITYSFIDSWHAKLDGPHIHQLGHFLLGLYSDFLQLVSPFPRVIVVIDDFGRAFILDVFSTRIK